MNTIKNASERVFRALRTQADSLFLPAAFVIALGLVVLGPLVFETLGAIEQAYLFADRSLFGTNEASNPPGRLTAYLVWSLYAVFLLPAVAAAIVIVSIAAALHLTVSAAWNVLQARLAPRHRPAG